MAILTYQTIIEYFSLSNVLKIGALSYARCCLFIGTDVTKGGSAQEDDVTRVFKEKTKKSPKYPI